MRDPIKENINEKTGKVTYEFSINLGVPPGEDKPFRTRRRGFPNKKAAWSAYMLMKARERNLSYLTLKNLLTNQWNLTILQQ